MVESVLRDWRGPGSTVQRIFSMAGPDPGSVGHPLKLAFHGHARTDGADHFRFCVLGLSYLPADSGAQIFLSSPSPDLVGWGLDFSWARISVWAAIHAFLFVELAAANDPGTLVHFHHACAAEQK